MSSRYEMAASLGGKAPHDRRTHWTRGKPRNPDVDRPRLKRTIKAIAAKNQISECARRIGVARKTIYKWSSGICIPAPTRLKALEKFAERL